MLRKYEIDLLCNRKISLSNPVYSQREIEVLAFLCNGRSHKFIASALGVSVRTVETHARNIVSKSTLPSMERVIDSCVYSGDMNILNSVYAYEMYSADFDKFISGFQVDKSSSKAYLVNDGDLDGILLEKITSIFERVGIEIVCDKDSKNCRNILIKFDKSNNILLDDFYAFDLETDGFFLGILKCLKLFSDDQRIDLEIQKYRSIIGAQVRNDHVANGLLQEWREKMRKGRTFGVVVAACGVAVIAGGLYGFYPRQNAPETITNQKLFAKDGFFFERNKLMNKILGALAKKKVVVLTGAGGAGKTTLAENVMRSKFAKDYDVIYKFNAENASELEQSMSKLADKLAITEEERETLYAIDADGKRIRRYDKIVEFVKERLGSKKWMLVFDNVEDFGLLDQVFPIKGEGAIIITTRDQNIKLAFSDKTTINVGELTEEEKVAMFTAAMKRLDNDTKYSQADIQRLMSSIPGYPLDITTVACCLSNLDISVDEYIANMKAASENSVGIDESMMYSSTPYGKTRYGIIVTTLNKILSETQDNPDIKASLLAISMCEPQYIPKELFARFKGLNFAMELINLLNKYSFITDHKRVISIHRVVQDMWFKILSQRLSTGEISEFLDVFFTKVISFEEVTHDYRAFKEYSYPRNFYRNMFRHMNRFVELIQQLPLEEKDKHRHLAKALAIRGVLANNFEGNYDDMAADFKKALELDKTTQVFKDYDRAVLLDQLWNVQAQLDIKEAHKILDQERCILNEIEGDVPLKCWIKLNESTEAKMNGNQAEGFRLLQEGLGSLPKSNDYWKKLIETHFKMRINDRILQCHINDKEIAQRTVDEFSSLLKALCAGDLTHAIKAAKQDKMPRIVALLMVERLWAYNLAEQYTKADNGYKDFMEYLEAYPVARYRLRAQTYHVTTLLRLGEIKEAKKLGVTTYNQWKLAGSKGMVYETLADLTEACVRGGDYEEALKYAQDNPGDSGMNGVVQAFADARTFLNYGIAASKLGKENEAVEFFNKSLEKVKVVAKSCLSEDKFAEIEAKCNEASKDTASAAFKLLYNVLKELFGADNRFISEYLDKVSVAANMQEQKHYEIDLSKQVRE